jgi:hypothetical protein
MANEHSILVAHPLRPLHLGRQVEYVAKSFNPDRLLPPREDEVFESTNECFSACKPGLSPTALLLSPLLPVARRPAHSLIVSIIQRERRTGGS